VVDLLALRGTRAFGTVAGRLYGRAAGRPAAGGATTGGAGREPAGARNCAAEAPGPSAEGAGLGAAEAAAALATRLADFFGGPVPVRVAPPDSLAADAAARGGSIQLRADVRFSPRDLRLLEVHEGWVHLGTTRNARAQPVCTFLGKGPPSATVAQEGLAVLTEVASAASHHGRVRLLALRAEAVARAEAGADFLQVYRFFLGGAYAPREAYRHAARVFRGGLPAGCGPFPKDLAYSRGLALARDFARAAAARGRFGLVALLFCGKASLDDAVDLARLGEAGLVAPPAYLPPPFADPGALRAVLGPAPAAAS
jgi:uncharacterized protein (TIGR02421 family)